MTETQFLRQRLTMQVLKRLMPGYQIVEAGSIDEFIESIPYNETRLYVKKVFSNYNIYNKVYGNDTYLAQADLELKPKYENSNEDLF